MASVLSFDEINYLQEYTAMFDQADKAVRDTWYAYLGTPELKKKMCDTLEDLIVYAFVSGIGQTDVQLDFDRALSEAESASVLRTALDHKSAGKTLADRVEEHINENSLPKMLILADTEIHRAYNEGMLAEAHKIGCANGLSVQKTWHTMEDERVRESHYWLDQLTLPIDMSFCIYNDSALAPGMFSTAEENVNCRCWLTYSIA